VLLEPVVQIGFSRLVPPGNELLRRTVRQQAFDLRAESIELTLTRPLRSAEFNALRLLVAQSLRRALRDQIAFDLCRRLIKNAIICWNYLYLSQLLGEAKTEDRRTDLVESIKHGSVVSWQHINLHGEYDFSDDKLQDSVGLDLPKIVGFLQGKKWEVKNQAKSVEQMSLPEIL